MKKQFITGALLLAVTAGGFSTFTSCKDTDEDLYQEVNSKQVALQAALKALQDKLSTCQSNCSGEITRLEQLIESKDHYTKEQIEGFIADYLSQKNVLTNITTILNVLNGVDGSKGLIDRVADLENAKKLTEQQINDVLDLIALKSQIQGLFGADGTIAGLEESITALNEALNGKDGEPGLIATVDGLSEWFENIGITPAEFQQYVKEGKFVLENHQALADLIALKDKLNGNALDALNKYYTDLEGIDKMYKAIFEGVEAPEEGWWNYATVMNNIKANSAAIQALQQQVDSILGRINDMVTSLLLQATTNPVFGSLNTPFGVNSMVLMTCYGHLATGVRTFPASGRGAECYTPDNDDIDWSAITSDSYTLQNENIVALDKDGNAPLGNLWFTVNPGTVNNIDVNGFAIVNSREDAPLVNVANVTKDDETLLKFGVGSRAAGNGNGLYRANATVAPENLDKIKVNIESGLVNSLKDAVQNRTASDMVQLLKAVYNQLQDICDANALRYTYDAISGRNDDGSWMTTQQKVYSNYGLAATAFKPLSFATLKGTSIRHLPTISPIEINKDLVDLDLGTFEIDSKNFNLNLNFGKPSFGSVGNLEVTTTVTLTSEDGTTTVSGPVTIDITKQAQDIQDSITGAIDEWLGEGDNSLDARVEKSIWYALFNDKNAEDPKYPYDPSLPTGVVADLIAQVNEMTGNIQGKLDDVIDSINKDYLSKVNTLIDKYNTVTERINKILDDPNHYLQVTMLYRKAGKVELNGAHMPEVELPFGLLSTDASLPTQFKGTGDVIKLWATTYNFEVLAPAFKKIVAVTKVTDGAGQERPDLMQAANSTLAKVMNGDQNQIALNVAGAKNGVYTYELAYQALDYTGHTSTVKCYVQVVR